MDENIYIVIYVKLPTLITHRQFSRKPSQNSEKIQTIRYDSTLLYLFVYLYKYYFLIEIQLGLRQFLFEVNRISIHGVILGNYALVFMLVHIFLRNHVFV